MTVCALPWDASLNGRGVGDWNPGRPMATPAETVDAYCVDWCKARCEALGADAKDAWRPEARLPSFHTIAPVATAIGLGTFVWGQWAAVRAAKAKTLLASTTSAQLGLALAAAASGTSRGIAVAVGLLLVHGAYKAALFPYVVAKGSALEVHDGC